MKLDSIRGRLDDAMWRFLLLMSERVLLEKEVARQKKQQGIAIHAPDREAQLFEKVRDWCRVLNLDGSYIMEIVSLMVAHSKQTQCEALGVSTFLNTQPVSPDELRTNLLRLTAATAGTYGSAYCEGPGANAIQVYLGWEEERITQLIQSPGLPRGLAVDLGCATGMTTRRLQQHFDRIRAFDVCPQMVTAAQERMTWYPSVSFEQADLEQGIPVEPESVSFAVANFGAASEVSQDIVAELARILAPRGAAFVSFYNQDALSGLWYYPWPSTVRAHHNQHNHTLEVWFGNDVYVVQALGMTADALRWSCLHHELQVEALETGPTILSLIPQFMFNTARFAELIAAASQLDKVLAPLSPHRGTYLTAVIRKPS